MLILFFLVPLQQNDSKNTIMVRTNKQLEELLLSKIIRMEALEMQFGIELKNVTIVYQANDNVYINYEIVTLSGSELETAFHLNFVVYDKSNSIRQKRTSFYSKFELGNMQIDQKDLYLETDIEDVAKLLIYPSE